MACRACKTILFTLVFFNIIILLHSFPQPSPALLFGLGLGTSHGALDFPELVATSCRHRSPRIFFSLRGILVVNQVTCSFRTVMASEIAALTELLMIKQQMEASAQRGETDGRNPRADPESCRCCSTACASHHRSSKQAAGSTGGQDCRCGPPNASIFCHSRRLHGMGKSLAWLLMLPETVVSEQTNSCFDHPKVSWRRPPSIPPGGHHQCPSRPLRVRHHRRSQDIHSSPTKPVAQPDLVLQSTAAPRETTQRL